VNPNQVLDFLENIYKWINSYICNCHVIN